MCLKVLTRAPLDRVVHDPLGASPQLIPEVVEVLDRPLPSLHLLAPLVRAVAVESLLFVHVESAGGGGRAGEVRRGAAVQPRVLLDQVGDDEGAAVRGVPKDLERGPNAGCSLGEEGFVGLVSNVRFNIIDGLALLDRISLREANY